MWQKKHTKKDLFAWNFISLFQINVAGCAEILLLLLLLLLLFYLPDKSPEHEMVYYLSFLYASKALNNEMLIKCWNKSWIVFFVFWMWEIKKKQKQQTNKELLSGLRQRCDKNKNIFEAANFFVWEKRSKNAKMAPDLVDVQLQLVGKVLDCNSKQYSGFSKTKSF